MSSPLLIIFSGQAGSGKTRRAKNLSRKLGLPYFDYDTLVQPFLQEIERRNGIGDGRLDFYASWREPSYSTLWNPVIENLKLGQSVILSAPLTRETQDSSFFSRLKEEKELECTVVAFYLAPSLDLHFEMISHRSSYRDDEIIRNYSGYNETHKIKKPIWDADYNFFLEFSTLDDCDDRVEELIEEIKHEKSMKV